MKKMLIIFLIFALIISISIIGDVSAGSATYSKTSVYGTSDSIEISITSLEQNVNNVTLTIKIQASQGYSLKYSASLFEKYLFAGCVLDCTKEMVIDTYWDYANLASSYSETVGDHSYSIALSNSGSYYYGNVTLPNLTSGEHILVIYALGETNMMSFNDVDWAAFSDPINFIMAETGVPLPVENTWKVMAPMPTARYNLGVAVVDGKIYAIGGEGTNVVGVENEMYDPATNTWATKQPSPQPITGCAVVACQGKIYCVGNQLNQIYDTKTDSWSTGTPSPTSRNYPVAAQVNGKIYLIAGWKQYTPQTTGFHMYDRMPCGLNEMYDPQTDTWASMMWMPSAPGSLSESWDPVVGVIDDKIYVVCGTVHEIYDTTTNTWNMPTGTMYDIGAQISSGGATSGLFAPKKVYIFEGDTPKVLDPQTQA
jgi:hypothetical protein